MTKTNIGGLKMNQNNENKKKNLSNALKNCWILTQRLENSLSEKNQYNNWSLDCPDFTKTADKLINESSDIPELNFCDMTKLKQLFLKNYCFDSKDEAKDLHNFGFGKEVNPRVLCLSENILQEEEENFLMSWLKPIKLDLYIDTYFTSLTKAQKERTQELDDYFLQQLKLIKPDIIFSLGEGATDFLSDKDINIKEQRGQFFTFEGVVCCSTYNPSQVLKDQTLKRPVWNDLKCLAKYLKISI